MANSAYRRSKHPRSKKKAVKPAFVPPIAPALWEEQLAGERAAFPDANTLFERLENADPGTGFKGKR